MVLQLYFDKLFEIPLLFMRINRCHPDVKRDMKWALQFIFMHGVYRIFFCLLLYSVTTHDLKNKNFAIACANAAVALLYSPVSFQYFLMVWHQDKLRSMFKTMKNDFTDAECSPEERILVLQYAYRGRWVTKIWLVLALISASVLPLVSAFSMIYYVMKSDPRLVPLLELTYPKPLEEIKNDIIPSIIAYIAIIWYPFYSVSMYVGLVPMGPICMLHVCSQLEIMKRIIGDFYPKNGYRLIDTIKNMKVVVKQLQDIYGFVENIQNTFQYIYEFYMTGTVIIIPVAAYQIIQSFREGNISPEFFTMIVNSVFITSVPCYYSDLLMATGESVGVAIYMSGWEKQSERRERNLILMLLQRMTRPIVARSLFRTMCLDVLTDVYQQAYAIFNVMNATLR